MKEFLTYLVTGITLGASAGAPLLFRWLVL